MRTQTKERPILFSAPMVRAILDGTKTQTRRIMKPQPASVEYWLHGEASNRHEGVPTMRDADGRGWAMCGPYRCPYIGEGQYAGKDGRLANSHVDDHSERHSRLWVRETWMPFETNLCRGSVTIGYRASNEVRPDGVSHEEFGASSLFQRPDAEIEDFAADIKRMEAEGDRWRPSIFMPRWASRITLEIVSVRVERLRSICHNDCLAEGLPNGPHRQRAYWNLWDSINGPGSWAANPWVWVIEFRKL